MSKINELPHYTSSLKTIARKLHPRFVLSWIQLMVMIMLLIGFASKAEAQHKEKPRPEEWNNLIFGGTSLESNI